MRKQIQNFVLLLVIPYSLSRGMDSNDAWKFLLRKAMSSVQLANSETTCGQASLSAGCCRWNGQACFVEGGSCYCDNMCKFFGDCCCDVPEAPPCDFVLPPPGVLPNRNCLFDTTTSPSETTPEVTTIATPQISTTPLPPTCKAHGLNNGPDGCCIGFSCHIEHDNGGLCYCDRACHDRTTNDNCCEDVTNNGCYPRTCTEAGINDTGSSCCNDANREGCRVQTSKNDSCYCDTRCSDSEYDDCCDDAHTACPHIQALPNPDGDQVQNLLTVIETDNSALFEKMAAAFWRRYYKKRRRNQRKM